MEDSPVSMGNETSVLHPTRDGVKVVSPLDVLFEGRKVFLFSGVNPDTAKAVASQLLVLDARDPNADITLYINSPGGTITDLWAIYDAMQMVQCDVATVCLGQAASAASVILAAGAPGKRYCAPNSRVLIHQPRAGLTGQETDLSRGAREITRMRRNLEELMSKHTGQPISQIRRDFERDTIFTAEQAIAYGIADALTVLPKQAQAPQRQLWAPGQRRGPGHVSGRRPPGQPPRASGMDGP